MIQKKYLILITLPLAILAIILMLLPKPEKRGDTNEIIETDSVTGFEGTTEVNDLADARKPMEDLDINKLIKTFTERYANKLDSKRARIKLLGGLLKHFKRRYPDDWEERIKDVLLRAFPNYYDILIKDLEKTEEYYAFIKNNRSLEGLDPADRMDIVWSKRKDIFGEDYKAIWNQEINKMKIITSLSNIDLRKDLSLEKKLDSYKDSVGSLHTKEGDKAEGLNESDITVRTMNLTDQFLDLPSVQDSLDKMKPVERKKALRDIRTGMGLDLEAVSRLEAVDNIREQLWENSSKYTIEKEKIVKKYSGDLQTEKLDEIRKKYFGEFAEEIKAEEETLKYYRFMKPQKWGTD
jgi:hypothetical protein